LNQLKDILLKMREDKGWNKSRMAHILGISSQLYGQYENGDKIPGGEFFIKWKQVFGRDLTETIVSHETDVSTVNEADINYENASDKEKYIKVLERDRNLFEFALKNNLNLVTSNLTELLMGQRMMHAHLKTLLQVTVIETAAMQGKDPEKALNDANKVVAGNFSAFLKTDSVQDM
jgi:transcriptional regulator with XRE-family HTH domain